MKNNRRKVKKQQQDQLKQQQVKKSHTQKSNLKKHQQERQKQQKVKKFLLFFSTLNFQPICRSGLPKRQLVNSVWGHLQTAHPTTDKVTRYK